MTETHFDCGGELVAKEYQQEYVCQSCNAVVRASVVDQHERFKRVAQQDNQLSEIANAALEGVQNA